MLNVPSPDLEPSGMSRTIAGGAELERDRVRQEVLRIKRENRLMEEQQLRDDDHRKISNNGSFLPGIYNREDQ